MYTDDRGFIGLDALKGVLDKHDRELLGGPPNLYLNVPGAALPPKAVTTALAVVAMLL